MGVEPTIVALNVRRYAAMAVGSIALVVHNFKEIRRIKIIYVYIKRHII